MKFTNDTWFHTVVLLLITLVGVFMANLTAEIFDIKDNNFVHILIPLFISPPVGLYFTKRVKRK